MMSQTIEADPALLRRLTEYAPDGWARSERWTVERRPVFCLRGPSAAEVRKAMSQTRALVANHIVAPASGRPTNCWLYVCDDRGYRLSALPPAARRNIRRGCSELRIDFISGHEVLEHGLAAYCDTRHRVGLGDGTPGAFHERFQPLIGRSDRRFLGAWKDGTLAGFLSIIEGERWCEVEGCFSQTRHLILRPNDAMLFSALKSYLVEREFAVVSYGLSSLQSVSNEQGLHAFKTKIGFTAVPVRRVVTLHPALRPLAGRLSRAALQTLLRVWPRHRLLKKADGALGLVISEHDSQARPTTSESRGPARSGIGKRPLRVLYVTSQWPTDACLDIAPFVQREVQSLRACGVEIDVFPYLGGVSPVRYLRAAWQLRRRLGQAPYDLVHARFGQCGLVGRAQWGVPLVVTFGGSDLEGAPYLRGLRRYRHYLLRLASRLASLGADAAIVVSAHLGPLLWKRRCHVIPAGVDLEQFRPVDRGWARAQLGWSSTGRVALFVADPANARKRFPLAREACELAGRSHPLELVVVTGQPAERVALFMNAADVLILTSTNEGSPNVVKEALACDLPVVAVDSGDVRERLAGLPGCEVCAEASAPVLAAALVRTLACGDARPSLRPSVVPLEISETARRIVSVYEEVLGRGAHREETVSGGTDHPIEIRAMTAADLIRVGELHRVAFPGSLSSRLGRRYHEWLLANPRTISVVAVDGPRIVGFTHGAPEGYATRLHRELFWHLVAAVASRPWTVVRGDFIHQVPARLGHLLGRHRGADRTESERGATATSAGICVAVDPDYRGRGVGRRLVAARTERAFAFGFDRVSASVSEENLASRRLFESLGWRPTRPGRSITYLLDRRVPPDAG